MKRGKIIFWGFLKIRILLLLAKKPSHGYELIKKIQKETGFWKPSPGTLYPLLHSLLKERLVKEKTVGKRKVYSLTEKGKRAVRKIKSTKEKLESRLIETFSSITGIKKRTLQTFFRLHKSRKGILQDEVISEQISRMICILLKLRKERQKINKVKEILERTNRKLEKLK